MPRILAYCGTCSPFQIDVIVGELFQLSPEQWQELLRVRPGRTKAMFRPEPDPETLRKHLQELLESHVPQSEPLFKTGSLLLKVPEHYV